jgi:hypothetical protein
VTRDIYKVTFDVTSREVKALSITVREYLEATDRQDAEELATVRLSSRYQNCDVQLRACVHGSFVEHS